MDAAFRRLHELLVQLAPVGTDIGDLTDDAAGVRTWLTAVEIDTPIEIDVGGGPSGGVSIGASPPLYSERTSWLPSFHSIRFRVEAAEA